MYLAKSVFLTFDLTICIALLVLGVTVFVSHVRSKLNVYFALFAGSVSVWIMTNYLSNDVGMDYNVALIANRAVFVSTVLSAYLLLQFIVKFCGHIQSVTERTVVTGCALFGAVAGGTSLIVDHIVRQDDIYAVGFGRLAPLYFVAVSIVVCMTIYTLLRAWSYQDKVKHVQTQIRIVGATVTIGLIVLMISNFVVPAIWGVFNLTQFGTVPVLVLIATLMYAIVKHGLFDIRLAAVRTVAYVMSIATMAGAYFGLAYIASVTVFRGNVTTGLSMSPINIILALVLAFIFQPIKKFFDHWTNRIFYRDRYDTNEFITRLGRVLTSTTRLHEVLERAGHEIETTLKASGSMFLVYRDHHPDVVVSSRLKNHFDDDEYIVLRDLAITYEGKILEVASLEHAHTQVARRLYAMLSRRKIALVLPLLGADETIGYLLLGEQLGSGYAKRDIGVLETIADELVIAIQNARSVQVVRDLNTHLEQRINSATKELRASNKRLVELDETKDEFLSMASHQLRTPLTSVKGYISMVLEGDAGEITKPQRQLLEEAFNSSERMVHLIGDFLNVSRLQTGKFVIEHEHADLAHIIGQEIENLKQIAATHAIKLTYRAPTRFPALYIDENKIRQVIMNFIDNAIYYSPEATPIKVTLSVEDGDAVVRVIDKGMGVPDEVKQKLFTKFFRAENARKQRPDGTGIGLFLAKKVIDGHGGSLVFESTLGKGSVFGFRLPIAQLSEPPVVEEQQKTA